MSERLTDLQFSLLGSLTTVRGGEASETVIKGVWGFSQATLDSLWRRRLLETRTTATDRVWCITDDGRSALVGKS